MSGQVPDLTMIKDIPAVVRRRPESARHATRDRHLLGSAEVLATARGIACVVVDYDALRGMAPKDLTLF
jgi:hypothetical protein